MARILIVGGGYIGMYVARHLERTLRGSDHELTLVNPDNYMLYQPFLPEVASGLIDPRAVVVPLRGVLRRTTLVVGEVERVDHTSKVATVRLTEGERRDLGYDVVVLGTGSWSRTLPIPGLAEHGVGFKTLAEAIWLRNRVLSQLDRAAELLEPEARRAALTFVFVGAGFAGVEALGELEDLGRAAAEITPELRDETQRWVMVEAGPRILPELDPDLAGYAADRLRERGIELRTSTRLERADDGLVRLSDGTELPAETLVWTAGVKPSPVAGASGLPVDERGRLQVDAAMRVRGLVGAWAGGDVAAVPDRDAPTGISPPTAQHALRQARTIARNITATLQGGHVRPFRYSNKGMLCSLGHYRGVADPLGVKIKGFPAWFLHRSYHLAYMPTWSRKARIALDWTVALLFPRDVAAGLSRTSARRVPSRRRRLIGVRFRSLHGKASAFSRELQRKSAVRQQLTRIGEHGLELVVGVERIVMEQHQPFDICALRERHGIAGARVAPADPLLVFGRRVLAVVDEHVRVVRDGDTGDPVSLHAFEVRAESGLMVG
jgi:NADH dehydrogenase